MAGVNGVMKLTSFEDWCKSQPNIDLEFMPKFGDIFDIAGIDAIIKMDSEYKPVQFRIRTTSRYSDVTVRKMSGGSIDRSYKIGNVPLFIYITPKWWVILDTLFYREVTPSVNISNNDGTDFYVYPLEVLRPYIVATNHSYYNETKNTPLSEVI